MVFEGPHIEADIYFLSEKEGGRRNSLFSGYRGQFHYADDERPWDAVQEYVDRGFVEPGSTVKAYLTFASPQEHYERIIVGLNFTVREGKK